MSVLKIAGGRIYDPVNGLDGVVADLWIRDGRIVEKPDEPEVRADRTIDARGLVVMPGGVDMHSHLVGPKVNAGRLLRPDLKAEPIDRSECLRSGTTGSVPSTFATSYLYAGLGYTTAIDAAIPPLGARQAHREFAALPILERAMLTLAGNDHFVLDRIRSGESSLLRDYVGWLLAATGGFGIKVVNPGGIEHWKQGLGDLDDLDTTIGHFEVTPRQVMVDLADTLNALRAPHAVHIHTIHLGKPGNGAHLLATMDALDGRRAHLAHVQFHSYGMLHGAKSVGGGLCSDVPRLAERFASRPELTLDVGQVLFGNTMAMTADGGLGAFLHRVTGRTWISHDSELSTGCGVLPITYEPRNVVHGVQWAIGLEWSLLVEDPWRIALTTDHPNGATFVNYPRAIALLMDRQLRRESLDQLPEAVRRRTVLADLDREYGLGEIATITRAAPSRILGLDHKGHLGPGADADLTIYRDDPDRESMFRLPKYVLVGGELVVEDGELRNAPDGRTALVRPDYDRDADPAIRRWFDEQASVRAANLVLRDEEIADARLVPCRVAGERPGNPDARTGA